MLYEVMYKVKRRPPEVFDVEVPPELGVDI